MFDKKSWFYALSYRKLDENDAQDNPDDKISQEGETEYVYESEESEDEKDASFNDYKNNT